MKRSLFILLMLMTFCAASSASADIIYSNGFPPTYQGSSTVGSNFLGGMISVAVPFTVGPQDYLFDSAQIYGFAMGTGIILSLMTSVDSLPGASMEGSGTLGEWYLGAPHPYLVTWSSLSHPVLQSGAEYWLVASPATQGINFLFFWDRAGVPGTSFASSVSGGPWQRVDDSWSGGQSFEVSGSPVTAPVPEPASLLLLGTGLVGLARWRRRRS